MPSDWKRPLSEKPGPGRRCRQDTPVERGHCPELPASFRPNQQPVSQRPGLTGTGRAGWPSPEGLQCHGCPPQGGSCSHGERPSCRARGGRTRLQLPALWERKLCAGHTASLLPSALSTSLPVPAGSTSLTGVYWGHRLPETRLLQPVASTHGNASTLDLCPASELECSPVNRQSPLLYPMHMGTPTAALLSCPARKGDMGILGLGY